jgi:hypothetical protein
MKCPLKNEGFQLPTKKFDHIPYSCFSTKKVKSDHMYTSHQRTVLLLYPVAISWKTAAALPSQTKVLYALLIVYALPGKHFASPLSM